MSTKAVRINDPTSDAGVARVAMKFEVVVIPVSDVDGAKEFYERRLGWRDLGNIAVTTKFACSPSPNS